MIHKINKDGTTKCGLDGVYISFDASYHWSKVDCDECLKFFNTIRNYKQRFIVTQKLGHELPKPLRTEPVDVKDVDLNKLRKVLGDE